MRHPTSLLLRLALSTSLLACAAEDEDLLIGAEVSSALTTTLSPTADATVQSGSYAAKNFGTATTIGADLSDGGTVKQGYLRFDLTSVGSIASARLRLYVTNASASSAELWTTSATTWSESTLTWNNRPPADGVKVATIGKTTSGTWIELDITSAARAGQALSLVLVASSSDGFVVASRESTHKPQLLIDSDATSTGSGSGSGSDTGTGSGSGTYDDDTHATLTSGAAVQVVSGDHGYNSFKYSGAADGKALVLDARTSLFTVANSRNTNPTVDNDCSVGSLAVQRYPVNIDSGDRTAIVGGFVQGKVPQSSDWEFTYHGVNESCNSAAVRFAGPQSVVDGVRITNPWDAVRFSSGATDGVIRNSWISNVRDDSVENDFLLQVEMVDTLVDGAFVGISVRPADTTPITSVSQNTVTLSGSLIRLRNYLYKGKQYYGGLFKMSDYSPGTHIYNSVLAVQAATGSTTSSTNWPLTWSKIKDCSNNLFLWMSTDPMPSVIGTPPACFHVVKGQAAIDLWNQSKANWIACHPKLARSAGDPASDPTQCQANTWGGYSD